MASATEAALRRIVLPAGLAVALALGGATARAEPSAADKARAEPSAADKARATQLMDDGFDYREKKDEQSALKAFGAADTLMNVPTTAIEVARSQAALGMLVEARDTAARVTKMPVRAKEPAPFMQARKEAEQLLADLGARLPSLQIELAGLKDGDAPEVRVDNEVVPTDDLRSPRRLNPGSHRVVVKLGAEEKTDSVTLAERESRTVTFDLGGAGGAKKRDGGDDKPSAAPKILMYAGFGVGVVGVGVGTVAGILSFSAVSSAKQNCVGNQCTANAAGGDVDRAKTLGNVSTVAFVLGGVGLATGVVGLLLDKDPPPPKANVTATIGPGSIGLAGRF